MLFSLGRRIERLLYFGFVLLLLCALEVYLAAAAAYFSATDTRSLDALVAQIESDESELQKLYDASKRPRHLSSERERAVASMRKSLGLPPRPADPLDNVPTYRSRLHDILVSVPEWWSADDSVGGILGTDKAPQQIVAALRELRARKIRDRGTVLGIETPRLLTLQYGSAEFRVSAQPLAGGLLTALYPLSVVWLGSFYITRQRELVGIRASRDFKEAFPHVLNFVAVDFSELWRRRGVRMKPKDVRFNSSFVGALTTAFRCSFVLVAVAPLVIGLGYSSVLLFSLTSPSWAIVLLAGLAYIVVGCGGVALVVQEAFGLYGKTFYE